MSRPAWTLVLLALLPVVCTGLSPVTLDPSPAPDGPGSPSPATAAPGPGASGTGPSSPPAASPSPLPSFPASSSSPPSSPAPSSPTPSRPTELRGVWVHLFDDTLKTPASIDRMLDRVAAAGANTVIAEVVRRQDAYYRSEVLPHTADPAVPRGFDPLAHLLAGAGERGLQVHAWVPLMPTYHAVYDALPRPAGWVWAEHGPTAPVDRRWVTRLADGTWDDHLDPGHPAVRDHLVAVVTEIARRYDVDAVHLDYLRYVDEAAGYNPAALARFREETGRGDTPAPTDAGFSDWRRGQVRSLLARIRRAVARAAPGVALSAAVIAQQEGPHAGHPFAATRAHAGYFQDWAGWLHDGLVDAVMPMIYFDQSVHGTWFAQWAAFARRLAAEVEPLVAPGVGAWLNTPAAGADQLAAVMRGTDGGVVYSYQQNAARPPHDGLFRRLPEGRWRRRVAPPRWD